MPGKSISFCVVGCDKTKGCVKVANEFLAYLADIEDDDEIRIRLVREPNNAYDRKAVRVMWQGKALGYVAKQYLDEVHSEWPFKKQNPIRWQIDSVSYNSSKQLRYMIVTAKIK